MPFSLGLVVPLIIMMAYIVLGWRRRGTDVPDDKFADTCYYLGFIFTITSIIFSLFDLPEIETRLSDMAIRFGAAMIATVLGLVARVYLVSFKRDAMDAMETAESSIIEAAEAFRVQLEMVSEKFAIYESKVLQSTELAAARVESALEANAKALNGQLNQFFTELAQGLTDQAKLQISTISKTTNRMEAAASITVTRIGDGLRLLDQELTALLTALRDRVNTTTLPSDHFTRMLDEPLQRLQKTAGDLAGAVSYAEGAILQSGEALEQQAAKVGQAGEQLHDALRAVDSATKAQASTQEQLDAHLAALRDVRASLQTVEEAIRRTSSTTGPMVAAGPTASVRPLQPPLPLTMSEGRAPELPWPTTPQATATAGNAQPAALPQAPDGTRQATSISPAISTVPRNGQFGAIEGSGQRVVASESGTKPEA